MKLVDNAKQAWRWISVQAMVAAGVLQVVWETIPADLKTSMPDSYVRWITLSLLVLGVAGRLVDQGKK